MDYDRQDIENLALCGWKESRGDGLAACVWQMHSVVNRVGNPGFPNTLHAVIYEKNQYTSMSVPSDPEYNLKPPEDDPIYVACLADAEEVLKGADDPTDGALYYANLKTAKSGWFFENIVNRPDLHPIKGTVLHHTFFG